MIITRENMIRIKKKKKEEEKEKKRRRKRTMRLKNQTTKMLRVPQTNITPICNKGASSKGSGRRDRTRGGREFCLISSYHNI